MVRTVWVATMVRTSESSGGISGWTHNVTGPTSYGGGWNDLCLLLNPGMGHGESVMTFERTRSQFSLYCVMGSNLFMTGNLSRVDPIVLETWGNERAIAINQDPLGLSHRVLPIEKSLSGAAADAGTSSPDNADPRAVSVTECGGEPSRQAWTWSTDGLVHNPSSGKCLNVKACQTAVIIDECLPQGPACDTIPGAPAANEVFEPPQHTSGGSIGQIQIKLANRTNCLTAGTDDSILVGPCIDEDEGVVEAEQQRWKFDETTNHITRALDGSCLTAPAAAPSPSPSFTQGELMLGRPLQGGKWAIVMLNNAAQQATITCGVACFAAMNFSKPPLGAHISDVWGSDLGVVNGSSISLLVPPRGGSRLIVVG